MQVQAASNRQGHRTIRSARFGQRTGVDAEIIASRAFCAFTGAWETQLVYVACRCTVHGEHAGDRASRAG